MMRHNETSWEKIYHDIDAILNGNEIEDHEASRQKARIIKLNWKPNKSNDKSEPYSPQDEILAEPILFASARDRRHMFR